MALNPSASSYHFNSSTGLSDDSSLPSYLRDLTPSQLQTYLNGDSPNQDLIDLLKQDLSFTGAGWVPDASGLSTNSTPTWVWIAGAGALVFLIFNGLGRR